MDGIPCKNPTCLRPIPYADARASRNRKAREYCSALCKRNWNQVLRDRRRAEERQSA